MSSRRVMFTGRQAIKFEPVRLTRTKPGHLLVKTDVVGLCTPELRTYRGIRRQYPWRGGHEVCGSIAGADDPRLVGKRVAATLAFRCGECDLCRCGLDNHCAYNSPSNIGPAGLSEYLLVDTYQVESLPRSLDPRLAALTEPLACVLHSIERARLPSGGVAAVIGSGVMSSLHVAILRLFEFTTIRIATRYQSESWLVPAIAADVTFPMMALTDGSPTIRSKVDVCFGVSLNKCAMTVASTITRPGGVIVGFGNPESDLLEIDLMMLRRKEITLITSLSHKRDDFRRAAAFMRSNEVPSVLAPICGRSFPFRNTREALDYAVDAPGRRTFVIFE